MVSPDEGGAKRSVRMANDLGLEFAMIHNRCSEGQDILFKNDINTQAQEILESDSKITNSFKKGFCLS